jgi:rsbT co-antagonist protein RsbR
MDSTTTRYLAELLRDHGDQIVKRRTATVAASLRGRLGEAELGRQVQELFTALRGAADASAADRR